MEEKSKQLGPNLKQRLLALVSLLYTYIAVF